MLAENPVSVRQAIILASRVLCAYFLYCAAANLINLPGYLHSLSHYWQESAWRPEGSYFLRYYLYLVASDVLRLTLEVYFAWCLYRPGPKIAGFLLGEPSLPKEQSEAGQS